MDNEEIIEIEEDFPYLLYRRGEAEHIKALYEKGEVYINTIDHIRKCDKNDDRSDNQDGISERQFIGNAKVEICKVGLDINTHGVSFNGTDCVKYYDSGEKGNIYCLSGIFIGDHLSGIRDDLEFNTNDSA